MFKNKIINDAEKRYLKEHTLKKNKVLLGILGSYKEDQDWDKLDKEIRRFLTDI